MLRKLVLKRIEELRNKWGSDRFGKPDRRDKLHGVGVIWPIDFDFSKLDDAELLVQFEKLVAKSYQQR